MILAPNISDCVGTIVRVTEAREAGHINLRRRGLLCGRSRDEVVERNV